MRGSTAKSLRKIARDQWKYKLLETFSDAMLEEFHSLPEEKQNEIVFGPSSELPIRQRYKKLKKSIVEGVYYG